ncbi:MAG: class I SAM-dependent methyltransferase [Acidobacteriia bacterium]|nr:class I SAM-dependent methyltransferase [Terriglobia bacterium]
MQLPSKLAAFMGMALLIALPVGQSGSPPQANDQLDLIHPLSFGVKDGRPAVTGCSERIVEVPFVHRNLPYPFRGRLLDVGYRESEIIYETASLGFETWGIDIRPPLAEYPGVRYVQGDVIKYPFEARSFDVVILLSTVEHIGLMAYGNTAKDPEGDLHALQAVHRILKPTGRLILTVPFGRRGGKDWYRVYDHQALRELLSRSGFSVETEDYWSKEGVRWIPTPWSAAEKIDSVTHHVRAVASVLARP